MDNPLTELLRVCALQIGEEQEHLLQPSSELRHLLAPNWTVIPEVVTTYSKLELLDLSDNLIEEYPIELGQLTSLTLLDLSDSALTEIPEFIGKLPALEELNLAENQLTEITGLAHLSGLFCDLRGNPIEQLPTYLNRLALDEGQLNYLKSQNALGHIQDSRWPTKSWKTCPMRLHKCSGCTSWILVAIGLLGCRQRWVNCSS